MQFYSSGLYELPETKASTDAAIFQALLGAGWSQHQGYQNSDALTRSVYLVYLIQRSSEGERADRFRLQTDLQQMDESLFYRQLFN